MTQPRNLSERALLDLDVILEKSFDHFGEMQAQATRARIYERCQAILDRHNLGHRMIAFDLTTREIIRLVHGRRDLAKLLR